MRGKKIGLVSAVGIAGVSEKQGSFSRLAREAMEKEVKKIYNEGKGHEVSYVKERMAKACQKVLDIYDWED